MKDDVIRCFRNPLYWLVLGAGLSVRVVLAYFDFQTRSEAFWSLSAEFWNKIGSVTLGFLVLLVLIRLFSADRETGVFPVINSTAYGRITLFRNRLIAGSIAASAGAVLLAAGNHALSILISGRLPQPDGWNHAWFRSTAIVLIGTIGFFLFAAFVCDSLKNQPAAMCICGVPFEFSYFINVAVLKKFEFFCRTAAAIRRGKVWILPVCPDGFYGMDARTADRCDHGGLDHLVRTVIGRASSGCYPSEKGA